MTTGTPGHCEHAGALNDCEYDLNELLDAIAAGDGFGVGGVCAACGELVDRTYQAPRTSEGTDSQVRENSGEEPIAGDSVSTSQPEDAHAEAAWENEGGR